MYSNGNDRLTAPALNAHKLDADGNVSFMKWHENVYLNRRLKRTIATTRCQSSVVSFLRLTSKKLSNEQ